MRLKCHSVRADSPVGSNVEAELKGDELIKPQLEGEKICVLGFQRPDLGDAHFVAAGGGYMRDTGFLTTR